MKKLSYVLLLGAALVSNAAVFAEDGGDPAVP